MKTCSLKLLLVVLVPSLASCQTDDSKPAAPTQSLVNMNANQLFETALAAEGHAYLEAEAQLQQSPGAATELRTRQQSTNHFERAFATVILDWIEGRSQDNEAALAYFPAIAEEKKMTPAVLPRPAIVARDLSFRFKERVASFLAIRLVKETDWPQWRVSGVVLYLTDQKQPATTAALIRFASDERREAWHQMAITAIKAINDPALPDKIKFERLRAEAMKKPFPRTLAELEVQ